jgi:hypothetical protein
MTEYKVTIERTTDAARFARTIRAGDESALLHLTYKMLLHETHDYYVVCIETPRLSPHTAN